MGARAATVLSLAIFRKEKPQLCSVPLHLDLLYPIKSAFSQFFPPCPHPSKQYQQHLISFYPAKNMGAELSHQRIDDDVAPLVLSARTVKAVAEYIKSGKCKKVVFMVSSV